VDMSMYDPYIEFNPQVDAPTALMQQPNFSWQSRLTSGARDLLGNRDLALALLANSGPSPQKRSFGQILGASMQQADQAKQARADDEFKRQYMQAQMAALGGKGQRKLISVIGKDGKPVLMYEDQAAGMTPYAGGNQAKPSALLQAYNTARDQGFTGTLVEFQRELTKASAQYPNSVNDVGGVPTLVPRINPAVPATAQPAGMVQPALTPQPLSSLPREANAKQTLAAAGASGTATGEKTAGAQFDLPRVESNVTQALGDINKLKNHPGLGNITGIYSKAPIIPGTDQAAANALAEQVQGQTFLQAYNSLKGGGAITDIEGKKGEAAIARLNRSQSTEDYRAALDDLSSVLKSGLDRMRKQAKAPAAKASENDPLGIR